MGPSELPDESRETWGTASAEVSMADMVKGSTAAASARRYSECAAAMASDVIFQSRGVAGRRSRFKRPNAAGRKIGQLRVPGQQQAARDGSGD